MENHYKHLQVHQSKVQTRSFNDLMVLTGRQKVSVQPVKAGLWYRHVQDTAEPAVILYNWLVKHNSKVVLEAVIAKC